MSLRRYLAVCYIIFLGGFVVLALVGPYTDPTFSRMEFLDIAPVAAAGNVLIMIVPSALRVPAEARTGFRAYRRSNRRLIMMGVMLALITLIALGRAVG